MFQHQNSNKMVIVCRKGNWSLIKYLVGLNLWWHFFNRSLRPSFTLLGTKGPIGLLFRCGLLLVHGEFLLLDSFELVPEVEFCSFLLEFSNLFSYFDTFFNVGLMNFPLR